MSLFKNEITEFIENHFQATLATVSEQGQPMTATIYYVTGPRNTIRCITRQNTQKYTNILANPRAAVTIADHDRAIALNMIGSIIEITDTGERDKVVQSILIIGQKQNQDQAPIVKLQEGAFVALEFIPSHATISDFTKPLGEATSREQSF